MKFFLGSFLGLFLIFTSASCGGDSSSTAKQQQDVVPVELQKKISQKLIRSEPKVKDAYWPNSGVLLIGVFNDKTSRNGYASYICEVLYEEGLKGKSIWVKVVDIVKVVNDNTRVVLGEAHCI